jgi:hypothetical protein
MLVENDIQSLSGDHLEVNCVLSSSNLNESGEHDQETRHDEKERRTNTHEVSE